MHRLAVLGNPILHSLSPVIFSVFAKECGIMLNYERVLADNDEHFSQIVRDFFKDGGLALNVTSPFKNAAYNVADTHTSRAAFCQASNFLTHNIDGQIVANTTDGIGLVLDLQVNNKLTLENKRILIIGSGFVLESVLLDLIVCNPIAIDILARNKERLVFLQNKFAVGEFRSEINYDLIINTIPNGRGAEIFAKITRVNNDAFCYDMNYTMDKSLFLNSMQMINPNVLGCNGLGMLVEQAKVAFIQLFNHTPDIESTFAELSKNGYHV